MSDRINRAVEVLRELLDRSGFETTVQAEESEDQIRLDVQPASEDDAQLLIGRQGQTLAAYQLILNRIVNRFPEDRKPIALDVSGFSERRKDRLREMARRVAGTIADRGVQLRVLGMNPGDRRIVHLELIDRRDVSTYSENQGIARELVVNAVTDRKPEQSEA